MSQLGIQDPEIESLIGSGAGSGGERMDGGFEAASRLDREMATWDPMLLSADAEILPSKHLMDARSRDSLRNDAYVANGAKIRQDSIVGAMFMLNSKPHWKVLGLDETWATEFQEEVESKFTLYAESPECWIDCARKMTFTDMIRLLVGLDAAGGEYLATAEWLRDAGRPYHTAFQVVDTDRLSTPDGEMEGPRLRGGVRMNRWGAPQGYYIRNGHPSDWFNTDSYQWKYVPARKPWGRLQVLHIFEQLRPDQTRGISDMVNALKEIRTTKKFRDITLQNAVLNATYAASIESDLPSEAVYGMMGAGDPGGDIGKSITQYAQKYLSAIAQYVGSSNNIRLDGVKIPHLFPGTKLNLQPVGKDNNVGSDFEKSLLRHIAASLGVGYEELSRDYAQANYSNIKASLASTQRAMRAKKRRSADRGASLKFRLWLEEAINKGDITSMPRNAPNMYEGVNMEAYAACEWIGASLGQIDELKETQAAVLRLKYNLSTHEDEAAKLGKDWRKLFAQREREETEKEDRNLVTDEANSINAASGAPREKEDGAESAEWPEEIPNV